MKAVLALKGTGYRGKAISVGFPQRYVPERGCYNVAPVLENGYDCLLYLEKEVWEDAVLLPFYPTDGGIEVTVV